MKNYFISILLMLQAHEAIGAFEIIVTYHFYSNPSGRCAECPGSTSEVPACCNVTSFVPLNQSCPVNEACDTALSGCFRRVGSTGTSCFRINFQGDSAISARNFTFGNSFFGFPNPSRLTGNRPWQGTQIFFVLHTLSQDGSDVIDQIPLDIPMDVLGTPTPETTYSGLANLVYLTASIVVRCADTFYGPDCFTQCSNFVNCAGCDLSGYAGQFCHDIDDCVGRDCNNGECVDEVNGFRCECNSGFTGQLCTTNIDDCDGINCMNGECVDQVNGFRCECRPGFMGDLCETNIDDCIEVDCNNNGQCIDETDNFRCECNLGFSGNLCQTNINDCLGINCNNGMCVDGINSYRCECQNGFTGDSCEIDINECERAECNNGECVDEVDGFRCDCSLGFTGERCDINIDDCADANCNSGDCRDGINSFTCVCNLGFTGEHCETDIDDCTGVECNRGECVDEIGGFECECEVGFTGELCETNIDDCEGVECNNGTCEDRTLTFTCECDPGFTGELCTVDINHCEGINCNNGACIDGVTDFSCSCNPGFTGDFCQDLASPEAAQADVGSIAGGVVGGMVLMALIILIVVAVVILMVRRSESKGHVKSADKTVIGDNPVYDTTFGMQNNNQVTGIPISHNNLPHSGPQAQHFSATSPQIRDFDNPIYGSGGVERDFDNPIYDVDGSAAQDEELEDLYADPDIPPNRVTGNGRHLVDASNSEGNLYSTVAL